MDTRKKYFTLFLLGSLLGWNIGVLTPINATTAITLNNFVNDYTIDGFVSVWYYNMTDQQDISVRFDSSILRLITGVRLIYRTQNLLNPLADCNVSYKFESGEYIYYNAILPNSNKNNWTYAFYCQGDTFLLTNTFFYIDMGCASDDPYIQVGFDKDHSGHSMYSLKGGSWTPDTVEYLIEAMVENVTPLPADTNSSGFISINNDFVDGYKISLITGDVCHFYTKATTQGEHFNMRLFSASTKLTKDANAIWLEEGTTEEKHKQYNPNAGDYVILIEPNVDGVDNGTYFFYWTYNPEPPKVNTLSVLDNDGNVQLSWTSPSDTDLAYYNIYRGTSPEFPTDSAHLISIPGTITGTNFEDRTWLPNGLYFYVITAVDNTGHESRKSNIVNTTVVDSTAPGNPTLQNPLDSPVDNDGIVQVNWTPPLDKDVQFYRLYRAKYSEFPLNTTYLLTNSYNTSYFDMVLYNGKYFYRVTAVDDNGLESSGSNEVSTTVMDTIDPDPPTNLTLYYQENLIILNWTASNSLDLNYYYIFRDTAPIHNVSTLIPVANTTLTSWIDAKLPPGTYYYSIIAVDLNGRRSTMSNTASVTFTEPRSYTLLLVLIGVLIGTGSVMGYAVFDRRRSPTSVFRRLNRTNLKNFFRRFWHKHPFTESRDTQELPPSRLLKVKGYLFQGLTSIKNHSIRLGAYIKNQLIHTGPTLQRKKISLPPPKLESKIKGPLPSKPPAFQQIEIRGTLKQALPIIIEILRTHEILNADELQTQTALSAMEVQQCLAFLSDQRLISVKIDPHDFSPKYYLIKDFDQKWNQLMNFGNDKNL